MTEHRSSGSRRRVLPPTSTDNDLLVLAAAIPDTRLWKGLTSKEVTSIEARFGWTLPPDLAAMLRQGLPAGPEWPDWRGVATGKAEACETIERRLAWPLDGMLYDIEHNTFWDENWGERPAKLSNAFEVARAAVRAAPVLIPVYSHRYLPAEPTEAGNPVFSVHQMDIIVYGRDLRSYLRAEAFGWDEPLTSEAREIRNWTRWMLIGR